MSHRPETLADLALSRGALDRAGHRRKDPGLTADLLADPRTRVATLCGDTMRVIDSGGTGARRVHLRAPVAADASRLSFFLGEALGNGDGGSWDGGSEDGGGRGTGRTAYLAVVGPEPGEGGPGEWQTLRAAGAALADRDAGIFTTALALANWHATHPHCPRCGARSVPVLGGWVRRCERDGSEHYPRTDPAVIMSVLDDDDRLLLARSPHWPERQFSVLAGFVEPGESFEAAVAREVMEEVGIGVTDVTYLGNQPWPFPSSEMVGFTARARGTRLRLDPEEIAEAMWLSRADYLHRLRAQEIRTPSGISIARRIIERWLGGTVQDLVGEPGWEPAAWVSARGASAPR